MKGTCAFLCNGGAVYDYCLCFCNRRRQYCFTDASKWEKSNSEREGNSWSLCLKSKWFMIWNRCTCHIAFDFVGEKIIVLRNVQFMIQCRKDESGARVVDHRIMEQKTNFTAPGTFFLCPAIFFQDSFLRFINGKNCSYSNCSCLPQLYEMKGVKIYDKGNALE